jgi:hypothetical protein
MIFAIALLVEAELDLAIRYFHRFGDVLVIAVVHGAVGLQHPERPDHVVDGDRLAVMPARIGIEPEGRGRKVVRIFVGFGHQRMADAAFVGRLLHQRIVKQSAAEFGQPRGRRALHDIGVEAVERADNGGVQRATLGRVRVYVIVAFEVFAIFGAADERRGCMPFIRLRPGDAGRQSGAGQRRDKHCRHRCPDMVKVHPGPFATCRHAPYWPLYWIRPTRESDCGDNAAPGPQ